MVKRLRRSIHDSDDDDENEARMLASASPTPVEQKQQQQGTVVPKVPRLNNDGNKMMSMNHQSTKGIPRRTPSAMIPLPSATLATDDSSATTTNDAAANNNSKAPIPSLLQGMKPAPEAIKSLTISNKRSNSNHRRRLAEQSSQPLMIMGGDPWEQAAQYQQQELQQGIATPPPPLAQPSQMPPPTVMGVLETNTLSSLRSLCGKFELVATENDYIDLSGSFLAPDNVFEDDTNSTTTRIPIFPEDFPPNQPMWPLAWWGIVDPNFCDKSMVDPKFFSGRREDRPMDNSRSGRTAATGSGTDRRSADDSYTTNNSSARAAGLAPPSQQRGQEKNGPPTKY